MLCFVHENEYNGIPFIRQAVFTEFRKQLKGQGARLAKITVQLSDKEHERFVNAKMRRKDRSLQALMIEATERLLSDPGGLPQNHVDPSGILPTAKQQRFLRELSLQTGKSVHQLIDDALTRTYDKNRMPTSQSVPPAHLEAHALLDQILMSGDQKAIEWIHGNLKMFAEALDSRVELPPAKRAKPGEQD